MTTNFLPAINGGPQQAQATGMTGLRTGQSFQKSRNDFQYRTGRVSPIRSASITALLSPREMVAEFAGRGNTDYGIQGYSLPKAGSPKKAKAGIIPKNKSPGPIEAEAKYRKQFPGSGAYVLDEDKTWTERKSQRQLHENMDKQKRMMMADILLANSKKPEKCTPSPNDYNVKKEKFLPSLGKGGAALLQAKADKVTVMAEAVIKGGDVPGPQYKITDHDVFKKRSQSIKFDSSQTNRLAPIKRQDITDFYETGEASKKHTQTKSPVAGFSKSPKRSFAEAAARQHKSPGVGAYKISERSYKMLSPSPNGRKR